MSRRDKRAARFGRAYMNGASTGPLAWRFTNPRAFGWYRAYWGRIGGPKRRSIMHVNRRWGKP